MLIYTFINNTIKIEFYTKIVVHNACSKNLEQSIDGLLVFCHQDTNWVHSMGP